MDDNDCKSIHFYIETVPDNSEIEYLFKPSDALVNEEILLLLVQSQTTFDGSFIYVSTY
jgi:hypothetical protein